MAPPEPTVDLSGLDVGDELGRGGQGQVFDVRDPLIEGKWRAAVKIYSEAALATLDAEVLEKFVAFARQLPWNDRRWLYETYAWPVSVVTSNGQVCGFLMRRVPSDYSADSGRPAQDAIPGLSDVSHLLNPDQQLRNAGFELTDRDRLRILETIATSLSRLHGLGVAFGDLSPKNVLFRLAPSPGAFFIDCDSVRLRGETALEQVETAGWEAPAGETRATIATDSYKFGLLATRLFARDQGADDASAIAAISPALGRLAQLSRDPDGSRRPAPGQWIGPLRAAASSVPKAALPAGSTARGSGARRPRRGVGANRPVRRRPQLPPVSRLAPRLLTRTSVLVMSGVALVVLALILVFVILPAPSRPPSTARDPAGQKEAAAINALLDQGVASQSELEAAMNHVEACSNLAADDSQIGLVVGQRTGQLGQATVLPVAGLANGTSLRSFLVEVIRISLHADEDYLAWVNQVQAAGCSAQTLQDRAYASGYTLTEDVQAAKLDFLSSWDKVAPVYGFQQRSQSDI